MNGAQGRSLPHIHVLRDTGAWPRPASRPVPGLTFSMHNGIEPPTRGFSIRNVNLLGFINQRVTGASDALDCSTVHNRAVLIHAKLTQAHFESQN